MATTFSIGPVTDPQVNNFCLGDNYQEMITDPGDPTQEIPNPETKDEYIERRTNEYVEGVILKGAQMVRTVSHAIEYAADKASSDLP